MENLHINRELWEKFVVGGLSPRDMKAMHDHLESDCEQCENFLADLNSDGFRASIPRISRNLAESLWGEREPDPQSRERILSAVLDESGKKGILGGISFNFKAMTASVALAAAAVVFALVVVLPNGSGTIKSDGGDAPAILLQVAVLKHNSDSPTRCLSGGRYNPADILFFRYELTRRSYVYLVRAQGENFEIISSPDEKHPAQMEPGVYDFREGNGVQGFPMNGLQGRQVFMAIASARPMNIKEEIRPLLSRFKNGKPLPFEKEWTADSFEILVDSGQ